MSSAELPRLLLIVVAAIVFIFIIQSYNNSSNNSNNNQPVLLSNNNQNNGMVNEESLEGFYADGEQTQNAPNQGGNMEGAETVTESEGESDDPQASEGSGSENEVFKTVGNANNNAAGNANNNAAAGNANNNAAAGNANNNAAGNANNNGAGNRLPNECYPKDVLTPGDLLPQDSNSTWAQTVPNGQGSLGDQNFLNAGFHVGINTVGQSLRNANLQLRSEPPNPQLKVSPWLQTTIEPDANRKAFEIGEV